MSRVLASPDERGRPAPDLPPVDQQPEPGDTFIELRDGVPWIGTEPHTKTAAVKAAWHFNPDELRDPATGKWITAGGGLKHWAKKGVNYHHGHGEHQDYTLHYAKGGGWDVHEGHHEGTSTLGPVLYHAKTADEAKAWAVKHHSEAHAPEPAVTPKVPPPPPLKPWGKLSWTPKGTNYHHSSDGKYTLHYASGGGWDVHEGHAEQTAELGPVLHHAKTAKEAKAWAQDHADLAGAVSTPKVKEPKVPETPKVPEPKEPHVATGVTPDGRHWTAKIHPGGKGSTYEIDAKPGGDPEAWRDMQIRAVYVGDGRVEIEHLKADGTWSKVPDAPAGGYTFEQLEARTKVYQSIAKELGPARVEEIDAFQKANPPGPGGVYPHEYGPWQPGAAVKVMDVLENEAVPGGFAGDAAAHKAYVAKRLGQELKDVPVTDLIDSLYPEGMSGLYAGAGTAYKAAAKNPDDYWYQILHGGTLKLHPKNGGYKPTDAEQLTEKQLREHAASTLIHSWAGTSNDHNPRALAIQEAAVQEFGLKGTAPWMSSPASVQENTKKAMAKHGHVYRKFLRAQYKLTQADFKARGITSVNVHRGMAWGAASRVPQWARGTKSGQTVKTPPLRPLSSWSVDPNIASTFASITGQYNVVLASTVPASAVLSWPRSGFGCLDEYELVVLAGGGTLTVEKASPHMTAM